MNLRKRKGNATTVLKIYTKQKKKRKHKKGRKGVIELNKKAAKKRKQEGGGRWGREDKIRTKAKKNT